MTRRRNDSSGPADPWRYGVPLLVGGLVRMFYLTQMEVPAYDPWRHLLLVENLRRGLGFSLFEGQPYIWYNPGWHHLLSLWPASLPLEWPATLLSLAAVPLLQRYVELSDPDPAARWTAFVSALLLAAFAPAVAFTCHYGSEAFAIFLLFCALWLGAWSRRDATGLVSGLLFGLALTARFNLAFNVFLFLPLLRDRRRSLLWAVGSATPLLLAWWRNHGVLQRYPFVFTWDGLATRSADFNPLSTLVIQLHPAVQQGLRRLHEVVVPWPEWLRDASGWRVQLIVFMLLAALALACCRKLNVALAGLLTLAYFTLFDGSLSSNFFRIYLALFPAAFIAIATVAVRYPGTRGLSRSFGIGLVGLALLCGLPHLFPPPMYTSERVTPPSDLLTADRYMVNSGFYHPESVMQRYPEKRFIGLPLHPSQFAEFRAHYPQYRQILWHDFNLQSELREALERGGNPFVDAASTPGGRKYMVMQLVSGGEAGAVP